MKSVGFGAKTIPIAFAVATCLAYGLLLPLTGFYWDDWPFAWIARFRGPADFIPAFLGFRPFLGPIFFLTTSLIPTNPMLWQVFALVIHLVTALAAWFALDSIWPDSRRLMLIASLLFLVFPGYSQHWVALTHINQEWISLIFYLLSFGFSARALRNPQHSHLHTIWATLFMVVGILPTEYFIGLEPIRLLFIWVIIAETTDGLRQRLIKSLKACWPYLLIWFADVLWLIYYYRSGIYVSYDLANAQAAPALNESLLLFGDAIWKSGLYVWIQVLVLTAKSPTTPSSLLTLVIVAVAFLLAYVYLSHFSPSASPPYRSTSGAAGSPDEGAVADVRPGVALHAVLIGLAGVLFGRVPSFAAGLPLTLQSSYDRFMISMMFGASLLIAGLVELLIKNRRVRTCIFAGLLALAVGQQFFNANIFRRDWQRQQQIYWQFAWRIPSLEPQTAILTQQMPLDYETDLSMTAALNWIYAPQAHPSQLAYALVYTEKRLGGSVLPNLEGGTPIQMPFRTVEFRGSTSQVIVIYVPPNGCLRVLDPGLDDAETYGRFPASLTAPIALSDPSLIHVDAPSPLLPNSPFGSEPTSTWCYYYEKAELARQNRDWPRIVQLASVAAQQGLGPQDAFEWLPFIEAYARTGDLTAAEQITRDAWNREPKVHRGLCVLWKRLQAEGQAEARGPAARIIHEFECGQ